jgi:ubiquitin-conjugating enzyme E2 variant
VTWWREDGVTANCHSLLAHAVWFWYACAVSVTNQLHMWAHAEHIPRPVRRLHALRLIVSPSHHVRHHRPPFRRRYCVTTGWLNPVLDTFGFFAGLERVVRAFRPSGPHQPVRTGTAVRHNNEA